MAESSDKLYRAEYAKSGRASCKKCGESIPKDSLRMAIMVQVGVRARLGLRAGSEERAGGDRAPGLRPCCALGLVSSGGLLWVPETYIHIYIFIFLTYFELLLPNPLIFGLFSFSF